MDPDLFDEAFFLGIGFITGPKRINLKDPICDSIYSSESRFIRMIPKFVFDAYLHLGGNNNSRTLLLSDFFIRLISPNNYKCARCIICDTYYTVIKRHLKEGHSLQKNLIKIYTKMFEEKFYFYMPPENREIEEFSNNKQNTPIKILNPKELSKEELRNSKCLICGKCGKVIVISGDSKRQIVYCPRCNSKINKNPLSSLRKRVDTNIQ